MAEYGEMLRPRGFRVGVVGAMGSGKTTLAEELNGMWKGSDLLTERFEGNIYLEEFYVRPRDLSFRSQLWFLTTAIEQRESITSDNTGIILEDPAVVSNFAFARAQYRMGWMNEDEWNMYRNVYEVLTETGKIEKSDFTIFLKTDPEILYQRVLGRGRGFERVTLEYLKTLNDSVTEIALDYSVGKIPSLIIDSNASNFRVDGARAVRLVESSIWAFKDNGGFVENVVVPSFVNLQ